MKLKESIDRIGVLGILIAVVLSPCCFPLFAFVLTALGLGTKELLGSWTPYVFKTMALISILGVFMAFRQHKNYFPLIISLLSGFLIFYTYHQEFNAFIIYAAMLGLLVASGYNYFLIKKHRLCNAYENHDRALSMSIITCPICSFRKEEQMPNDSCQFFYECSNCHHLIKPKKGDCCVFCSYGTVKCPPVQTGKSCCS